MHMIALAYAYPRLVGFRWFKRFLSD